MNAERWKQIDELFDAVLDLPENQRESFLSLQTNGDDDLRKEVLSLLKAHSGENDYLENSAMGIAAKNLAAEDTIIFKDYFIDQKIGSYKIEKQIGAGGMGEVYLATDEKLKRKVALKILPAEFVADDERIKRFQTEARAISALNHPNIVTIYDVGTFDNINFIATEYVEGKTFRELINGKPKLKTILDVVIQSCNALSAAHKSGIIHRDIKPENIMIRPDGYVKILDFGLAKLTDISPQTMRDIAKTAKGIIIGTPAYMSPEQVADEKVDHRTDLWSIGVVLYELITGTNPYKKGNRQATFQAILSEEPPLASSLNAEVSDELDSILVKALEKDADLSYQTASDFQADLKRVKREIDSSASLRSSSRSIKTATENAGKNRSRLVWILSLILIVPAALAIWFFAFKSKPAPTLEATEWLNARDTQLTDSPAVEGYPSLSPDGKNIIFASSVENDRNIYLQRVGGKNLTNLTPNSKENDTMPQYSPDGKFIVFRSERNPAGIYVMEETGENARRISEMGFHPSWSPDGKTVVVSDRAAGIHTVHTVPNSRLWTIDVATGEKRQLETKGDAIMPSWSPNGNRIAFWFIADGKLSSLATVPAEGGEPVTIAESDASDWNPIWSSDGKYLYFSSDRKGSMNLWRVPVDEQTGEQTGDPEAVSTPSKYARHLTISRDGKLLGYVRYESQSNVQVLNFDVKNLKVSGEAAYLTRGDREVGNPMISPDGELFVARQPSRTQEDLIVFDKNGENARNLTNDKFRERIPRWSPDGRDIVFFTDRSGKYQIWTIKPDGSDLRQITFTEKDSAVAPVFSPDGKRLAYTEYDGKNQSSFLLDLTKHWTQQTPQKLSPSPENQPYSVRDWSKDGKKLLFIYFESDGDENGIGVYDLGTQTFEKITDSGSNPFWLNDNRHFIFIDDNTLSLCDSATKKISPLYKPLVYEIQHAAPSPDNKSIYFRYLQVTGDVWLLDATEQK